MPDDSMDVNMWLSDLTPAEHEKLTRGIVDFIHRGINKAEQ